MQKKRASDKDLPVQYEKILKNAMGQFAKECMVLEAQEKHFGARNVKLKCSWNKKLKRN